MKLNVFTVFSSNFFDYMKDTCMIGAPAVKYTLLKLVCGTLTNTHEHLVNRHLSTRTGYANYLLDTYMRGEHFITDITNRLRELPTAHHMDTS